MLLELRIQNLALIESAELEFTDGMNVLTGETGAGKSIILGALGLVTGEKANSDMARPGADFAHVEAAFEAPDLKSETCQALQDAGIEWSGGEPFIASRRVYANGRSRALLNGRMVTNSLLKTLGDEWVDIHGQHERQSLFQLSTHMELLDAFARCGALRQRVREAYDRFSALRAELSALNEAAAAAERERERTEHEIAELRGAALQPGEDERLETERRRLMNAERIEELAHSVSGRLFESESSASDQIRQSLSELQELRELDPSVKPIEARIESLLHELEDAGLQLRKHASPLESGTARLEEIEARLSQIFLLKRKYGGAVPAILQYQRQAEERLNSMETAADRAVEVKEALREALAEATEAARRLSERRRDAAVDLEKQTQPILRDLGMPKARFAVEAVHEESSSGLVRIGGVRYKLTRNGMDKVQFLIAPNVGIEPKGLGQIASGGELSRVTLALKTVLAEVDTVSTLVFDEVDAGIGGAAAAMVGEKLRQLSNQRQTICVTHSPQIAAMADRHFHVEKNETGERTTAAAFLLDDGSRVAELAHMLGGDADTSHAHAVNLLKRALSSLRAGKEE